MKPTRHHHTFAAAKQALWSRLESDGWYMSDTKLKVPHASMKEGRTTIFKMVWFRPQSIYVGFTSRLGDARTLTYTDIRELTVDEMVSMIDRY